MSNKIDPDHYKTASGLECIDALSVLLDDAEFRGFLRGNAIKYLWRMYKKDEAATNARKAEWYIKRLAEVLEAEDEL